MFDISPDMGESMTTLVYFIIMKLIVCYRHDL